MPKVKAVLFDFDGVLRTDRFYTNLTGDYPDVRKFITTHIFGGELKIKIIVDWLRGIYTYNDINLLISEVTGIERGQGLPLFRAG